MVDARTYPANEAYPVVVAATLLATVTKFACTGSTFDNGIAFDRRYGGELYRRSSATGRR
jgi:hypothetical protein